MVTVGVPGTITAGQADVVRPYDVENTVVTEQKHPEDDHHVHCLLTHMVTLIAKCYYSDFNITDLVGLLDLHFLQQSTSLISNPICLVSYV